MMRTKMFFIYYKLNTESAKVLNQQRCNHKQLILKLEMDNKVPKTSLKDITKPVHAKCVR